MQISRIQSEDIAAKADGILAPQSGHVYAVTGSSTSKSFALPTELVGANCTFVSLFDYCDVHVSSGAASVVVAQTSSVSAAGVLTPIASTGFSLVPGVPTPFLMPKGNDVFVNYAMHGLSGSSTPLLKLYASDWFEAQAKV